MDTAKNWARKVDSMINRGAVATDAEVDQINAYLNRNFAFVAAQVHLPNGPGKQALQKVCSSCHPAEIVVNRDNHAGTRDQWAGTIDRMLARGAKGTNEEFDQITDYLVANFGYIPTPSYLPEGAAKKTVERVCGPCHGVNLLIGRRSSRAEWERTVNNMIGRGAIATPAEAEEISDYLARYLGPRTEK
jgi:cytochrome c5